VDAMGSKIITIEGLAKGDQIDPLQEAFVKHDALQCGFCTPGLVIACKSLLNSNPKPTLEQIRHGLSGNICRCGTYTNVFNAVLEASGQAPVMDTGGRA
jgi:xanthine dehydrogenase YagT iron-sulfur-binding subunit